MEVVNSRAALLSNYEVFALIQEEEKLRSKKREPSENLATVEFELKKYFASTPCSTQTPEQIKNALTKLLDLPLTKFEKLQIINLRPRYLVELHVLLEECEERFEEDKIFTILKLIRETLPRTDDPPLEEEGEEEAEQSEGTEELVKGELEPVKIEISREYVGMEDDSFEITYNSISDF